MATYYGTSGADELTGGRGNDTIKGGGGNDYIYVSFGNNYIYGDDGDDVIYGGGENDRIYGGSGNDIIYSYEVKSIIYGGSGDDVIYCGSESNRVYGGLGNDIIFSSDGVDRIDGYSGNDIVILDYSSRVSDIKFTLNSVAGSTSVVTIGGVAGTSLKNVESVRIYGGSGNDVLTGGSGDDILSGGGGKDKLDGAGGNDLAILDFWTTTESVKFTLNSKPGTTSTARVGGVSSTSVKNIEAINIRGGAGDDVLTGGAGNDTLDGGTGNDKLVGGAGDDILFGANIASPDSDDSTEKNQLDGGAGNDFAFLDFSSATKNVKFTLNSKAGTTSIATVGGYTRTSVVNIESVEVQGGSGDDTITGGDRDDVLNGGGGSNTLAGGAGNDILYSGLGGADGSLDKLNGGSGSDTACLDFYFESEKVKFSLNSTAGSISTLTVGGTARTTVTNIEAVEIMGGSAGDVLSGGSKADRIDGRAGDDQLYGGAGNDTLFGGLGSDRLSGGWGDDVIYGNSDRPYEDPGLGNDTLTGGAGADTFVYVIVESSIDTITDFSAAQGDLIDLSAIDADNGANRRDDAFVYIGSKSFSGAAGELRFKSGVLQADVDGDKVADLTVKLTGVTSLSRSNIIL